MWTANCPTLDRYRRDNFTRGPMFKNDRKRFKRPAYVADPLRHVILGVLV